MWYWCVSAAAAAGRRGAMRGVGMGCRACLESAAGRNRMSQCVSLEPGPQISGSRCSFPGQQGLNRAGHPDWHRPGQSQHTAMERK